MMYGPYIFGGLWGLWSWLGFRRIRRVVTSHDGRCCGDCLFTLKGLPIEGTCPECGHAYRIGDTIACWKHDLGLNGNYEYRHWPELPKGDTPKR
ncbi:MAG: hypothetical protein AAFS11_03560 [Planctomycetota bacterium]